MNNKIIINQIIIINYLINNIKKLLILYYKANIIKSTLKINIKYIFIIILPLAFLTFIFNYYNNLILYLNIELQYSIIMLISLYVCYIKSIIGIRIFYLCKNNILK